MEAYHMILSTSFHTSFSHQKKAREVAPKMKSIGSKHFMVPDSKKSKSQALSMASRIHLSQQPINYSTASSQIISTSISKDLHTTHAQKLKVLKHMLTKEENQLQALLMIDDIQRLAIDHLFESDIELILQKQYNLLALSNAEDNHHCGLHETALRFRLLRQQGFPISAEVFDKFKDEEGKIRCNSSGDIKGLMALYEASQLSFRGENVLDEAGDYSYQVLSSTIRQVDYAQITLVRETLKNPHHKSLAKFTSKNFLEKLPGENWWGEDLKCLAILEFKMVQAQHKRELAEISRWWKDLGLAKEMKFARDQPLKWYMWAVTCLTDPKLTQERIHLVKSISFIPLIDDIFDIYGQLHELVQFTDVVNRWDMSAAEDLPSPMKFCFKALDKITNEISYWVYETHGWNPTESLHKAWASLCNAFLVEAKWFASGHLPKSKEYLKNGLVSSSVHVILVHIFFLLGQGITKQNVEVLENNSGIIASPATILRLSDDLGSAKDEDQDGYDGSYINCFLNEHQGCSLEEALEHVTQLISESWKQLNEECLLPNPYSSAFTKATLDQARLVPLMYSYDLNHRLSSLEELVNYLFYETM